MNRIKIITIEESELRVIIREEVALAVKDALHSQDDVLLNISQICDRIPGMTRHLFNKLKMQNNLKSISGKYSLKAVKNSM